MPDFSIEDSLSGPVCGIDEAGRGPLAGPVVAACVFAPFDVRGEDFWYHVNDSKAVPKKLRDILFDSITARCTFGIGQASVAEIDSLNILQASFLAMRRAFQAMTRTMMPGPLPAQALVDGNGAPQGLNCPALPVIKGDSRSLSIAAASILAKVTRDRIMNDLAQDHPRYGWASNAGYPAPAHIAAIETWGVTEHHRRSFAPVRNFLALGSCRAPASVHDGQGRELMFSSRGGAVRKGES